MPSKQQFITEQSQDKPDQGLAHATIGSLHVTYRPGMITPNAVNAMGKPGRAIDGLVSILHSIIVSWDLQDEEDGPVIPLTSEGIGGVEVVILRLIFDAVMSQETLGEATGTTSSVPTNAPSLAEGN